MPDSSLVRKLLTAVILPALLGLGIPLGLGLLINGYSWPRMLAFMLSVLALEYFAIPLGLGLGLSPLVVFTTVLAEGMAIFLATVEALAVLGKLRGLSWFVARIQKRAGQSRLLRKYGLYGLAVSGAYLSIKGCAARRPG